jgi:hypothetical protein
VHYEITGAMPVAIELWFPQTVTTVIGNRRLRFELLFAARAEGEYGRENNKNVHTILSGHEFLIFLEPSRGALARCRASSADLRAAVRKLLEARSVADWSLSDGTARLSRDRTSAKTQERAYSWTPEL